MTHTMGTKSKQQKLPKQIDVRFNKDFKVQSSYYKYVPRIKGNHNYRSKEKYDYNVLLNIE
jgi:hypothetical protein